MEKFIERRGKFVELDDGETALAPVGPRDVVVALISQNFVMSPWRLRFEQRALDAWADGRLILVKLDKAFAPVGLRDLPSIDASFEAQREFKWGEVAAEIDKKLNAPAHELPPERGGEETAAPAPARKRKAAPRRKGGSPLLVALGVLLLLIGGGVLYAAAIMAGFAAAPMPSVEAALSLVAHVDPVVVAAVGGAMTLVGLIAFFGGLSKRARRGSGPEDAEDYEAPPRGSAAAAPGGVFVSYARANAPVVLPMIDAAKRAGRKFWLDQHGLKAGQGWAGEIVRAIRGAPGVLVMCSKAAFESDQVKREVYLADRYRKRLMPVFVEAAEIPDDFEFFFAGVQELHLHETPEAERPAALLAALETA